MLHISEKKAHEGTRRLLQESTSFTNKLKRSSIRDLNQRFRDSAVLEPSTIETKESQPYTQTLLLTKSSSSKDETQTVDNAIVKHRADDVDCALPPNLQAKENILSQELGTQAELIEDLIKTQDLTQQMAAGFESDIIIGPASLLGNRQQRERARRRKLQRKGDRMRRCTCPTDAISNASFSHLQTNSYSLSRANPRRGCRLVEPRSFHLIITKRSLFNDYQGAEQEGEQERDRQRDPGVHVHHCCLPLWSDHFCVLGGQWSGRI